MCAKLQPFKQNKPGCIEKQILEGKSYGMEHILRNNNSAKSIGHKGLSAHHNINLKPWQKQVPALDVQTGLMSRSKQWN